jgi:hypothetical protein
MSAHLYRVAVVGELGARFASAFEGMTFSAHEGGTEMTGRIIDPSHLQALIERIAGLGLRLQSVTPLNADTGRARAPRQEPISN